MKIRAKHSPCKHPRICGVKKIAQTSLSELDFIGLGRELDPDLSSLRFERVELNPKDHFSQTNETEAFQFEKSKDLTVGKGTWNVTPDYLKPSTQRFKYSFPEFRITLRNGNIRIVNH